MSSPTNTTTTTKPQNETSKTLQTNSQTQSPLQAQVSEPSSNSKLTLEDCNNFPLLVWEMDEEPIPNLNHNHNQNPNHNELLWLYTICGNIFLAPWPENELLGNHFIAWAYPVYQNPAMPLGSVAIH